jgi:hypothetical protein
MTILREIASRIQAATKPAKKPAPKHTPVETKTKVVKALKSLGYKQHSTESTAALLKVWFTGGYDGFKGEFKTYERYWPKAEAQALADKLGTALGEKLKMGAYPGDTSNDIFGDGFQIMCQEEGKIFLGVYKNSRQAERWKQGFDEEE